MFMNGSFAKNTGILKRTMDVSLLRRDVIADNIANSDTPNFKRTSVNFESQLKRALESENYRPFGGLMTDPEKIAFFSRPMKWDEVQARRVWDWQTTSKNNGNNVDMEFESMQLMENQLMYQTLSTVLNSEYSRVNIVLR